MSRRSWLAAGLATAAAVAVVTVPAQAAPPVAPTGVTLLTGDHVSLDGAQTKINPGEGREHIAFRQYTDERGDLHVVPADVQHLLSAKRLDPRLFDVTELVRSGYDDASSPVTPLIVQGGVTAQGAALSSIGAAAVQARKGTNFFSGARASNDERVWLDGRVTASLDKSVPQIGAPEAWQAGHTGKDATVAVLDTGIDATHPDLAGAVVEAKDFSRSQTGTDDRVGHGTHVASTITGDGKYKGVAPDAKLLVGKVLNDFGGGRESDIIAGMEWAAAAKADVVNMSLGSPWPSEGDDPMSQAVNRLTAQHGTLFVVAAGNSGPSAESIGSPAAADDALTVGAVDRQDGLAEFSSRGPRWENAAIKPDITAPGVGIVAARAKNSSAPSDTHFAASGTSMATPHVAGAAAILAAQHPDWTPRQLKAALMGSAKPNTTLTPYQQGAGRVDVARATTQTLTPSAGSLSLGTALWPHHDDVPLEQQLTYRNSGPAPVTLTLTAEVTDPSGKPAPAGMGAVEPSTVTVPAGGEATVKLTVRTAIDAPDGLYSGALVASNGIRTPIGFTKEVESYDVDLSFLDQDGKATEYYFYRFVAHDRPKAYVRYSPTGVIKQRIPKGKYYYEAYVQKPATRQLTQIVEPAFEVTGNSTFVNDARIGEQPGFKVDKPNAKHGIAELGFGMRMSWGDTGLSMYLGSFNGFLVRPATTSAPGAFTYSQAGVLAEPDANGGFAGSPYLYHLMFTHDGTVPSGLRRDAPDRSLAVVHSEVAAHTKGAVAVSNDVASGPVPLKLTEYYTPNTPWYGSVRELDGDQEFPPLTSQMSTTPRTFKLGRPVTERWNQAVFGPAFPKFAVRPDQWASRGKDELGVAVPMFTDQSATRQGGSKVTSARTVLYKGDTAVLESPYQGYVYGKVPAEQAAYRLHAEAAREGISELSTKITADWTFTSGHVAGEERALLPLLAVRFAPTLDLENRTRAGRVFTFPVYVQRNGSDRVTDVKTNLQVSYDDGATWQPSPLVRVGDRWLATVKHPKDAKFVSLKAQARDKAGNTVDQTIIRAYALK